jgi:hypothetical protein
MKAQAIKVREEVSLVYVMGIDSIEQSKDTFAINYLLPSEKLDYLMILPEKNPRFDDSTKIMNVVGTRLQNCGKTCFMATKGKELLFRGYQLNYHNPDYEAAFIYQYQDTFYLALDALMRYENGSWVYYLNRFMDTTTINLEKKLGENPHLLLGQLSLGVLYGQPMDTRHPLNDEPMKAIKADGTLSSVTKRIYKVRLRDMDKLMK